MRSALYNAETKHYQNAALNRELQVNLKMTYKKEREQYNLKKACADKQLEEAKQWVCLVLVEFLPLPDLTVCFIY